MSLENPAPGATSDAGTSTVARGETPSASSPSPGDGAILAAMGFTPEEIAEALSIYGEGSVGLCIDLLTAKRAGQISSGPS